MNLARKIFEPELYTYNDYKLWEGNWELINGYPIAMSPSPVRKHQRFSANFTYEATKLLKEKNNLCNCNVYFELDWIISDDTVVRPDCMIVCGDFTKDFLDYPPQLIVEISSPSTRMRDRNTKHTLFEMCGVKYYIIADVDKEIIETFELVNNKYQKKEDNHFLLTSSCSIQIDLEALF